MLGKAIKGKREKFMLATKCGIVDRNGERGVDGSRKAIREACLASLERLQTNYIDLYYLHRVDRSLPIEETFEEFKASILPQLLPLFASAHDTARPSLT